MVTGRYEKGGAIMKETQMQVVPLLTGEAARVLKVSPQTVRLWERLGRIAAVKTSAGIRLFDPRDVERLARKRD